MTKEELHELAKKDPTRLISLPNFVEPVETVQKSDNLPMFATLSRIIPRGPRKDGKVAKGWDARYGGRRNREFIDGVEGEQESKRKAVEWLWTQHAEFMGN